MHGWVKKALMLMSFVTPALVSGASVEWRTVYPRQSGAGNNFPAFENALETADGGYVVQGATSNDELLMSIDGHGKQRWLSRVHRADGVYPWLTAGSLRATRNGIVALWEGSRTLASLSLPQYSVVRYGDTGNVERRIDLGEVFGSDRGRLEVTSGGDLLAETAEFPTPDTYMLFAGKRRMGSGTDWKTPLMAAGFLDMVGAHELAGERSLFAVDRIGASADTLRLWAFDDIGNRLWEAAIPTGAKPAFAAEIRTVQWSAFAQSSDGTILAAGVAGTMGPDNHDGDDTLVLASVDAAGKPGWVKRYPISGSGKAGSCSLREFSMPASGNVRARLECNALIADLEIATDGALVGMTVKTLPYLRMPPQWGKVRMKDGGYAAFGSSQDSLPHVPVVDTHRVATAIGYPTLFAEPGPGGGEWKPIRLPEYADTVFSYKYAIPGDESGAHIWNYGLPGFRFFLPTSDGGALAGGSLWTSNAQDTVSFAVLKLAPGYAVGIAPGGRTLRPAAAVPGGAGAYDILGRPRRGALPPAGIFLTRPASAR